MSDSLQPYSPPCTLAHQATLSMGFCRQEYWSGLPCPPPGDLPNPGMEPVSLTSALAGRFFTTSTIWEGSSVQFSHCRVRLFVIPWTVPCQAPLSMGFCRQEYWSGLRCPPPGDLPNPEIESGSPVLQADSLLTELWGKPHLRGLRGAK